MPFDPPRSMVMLPITSSLIVGRTSTALQEQLQELVVYTTLRHTEAVRWNPADQNWAGSVSGTDLEVQLFDITRCEVHWPTAVLRASIATMNMAQM